MVREGSVEAAAAARKDAFTSTVVGFLFQRKGENRKLLFFPWIKVSMWIKNTVKEGSPKTGVD